MKEAFAAYIEETKQEAFQHLNTHLKFQKM